MYTMIVEFIAYNTMTFSNPQFPLQNDNSNLTHERDCI